MKWIIYIIIIVDVAVILAQILAITLLLVVKENNAKVTQKILLITLCATELCYAITGITLFCFVLLDTWNVVALALALMIFNVTTVTFFYICIMAMIEIDRFLEIYLNIYYQAHWSPKKTKIILTGALTICFLSFIPSFVADEKNPQTVGKMLIYYVVPILELVFFIIASCTYLYITKEVLRHRKNTKRIQQQLQKNYIVVHHREPNNRFKLLVPTLIIVTFLLFTVSPNIIRLFVVRGDISDTGYRIAFMFVSIGFIADALIYIFNFNVVRKGIRNIVWRHNSVHPTNC